VSTSAYEDRKISANQLLATSRKELDIERSLSDVTTNVSLSNAHVDEDIQTFIRSHLSEDQKFSRWPKSLRLEIELALVRGAYGM